MSWSASAASVLAATLAGAAITHGLASRREAAATAAHPPEGAFVEALGTRIHHVRRGAGPDLVLIHGAGGNLRDFTFSFLDRAAREHAATAFDRPGLGHSGRAGGVPAGPAARGAESILQQARVLRAASEALGIERPVVLGHSFGGAVALAWAALDLHEPSPAQASAVVALAAVTHPWPGRLGPLYTVNATRLGGAVVVPVLAAFAPDARIATAIRRSFAPQAAPEGYAEHLGGRLTLRRETLRANVRQVNALRPQIRDLARRYPEIGVPIEVVHGGHDAVTPFATHAEPLARAAPGARLTRLDGVGHMPHHVAPEAVIEAVRRARQRGETR